MAGTVHAFEYLAEARRRPPAPVCVVFGDDRFLKLESLRALLQAASAGEGEAQHTRFDAEEAPVAWRDVVDELATISLFGSGPRVVEVRAADPFISENRAKLERYAASPRSHGILILEVASWPANTKLHRAVATNGLAIACQAPRRERGGVDQQRMVQWMVAWAQHRHGLQLQRAAAVQLLELTGPNCGMLDQQLAKLALLAEPERPVTAQDVARMIGGWKAKTAWDLADAVAGGDAREALRQLDRLIYAGESPVSILAQLSWTLRRFAAATRIYQEAERSRRRMSLRDALRQAGVPNWPQMLAKAERQLRQIGRHRAGRLYRTLLELDLAIKSHHASPQLARLALERLVFQLSRPAAPETAPSGAR